MRVVDFSALQELDWRRPLALRRAISGHWTLQRHVSLAPRCNKVVLGGGGDERGGDMGVARQDQLVLLPLTRWLQLLRVVLLCAKRCQRRETLPRLPPYLWVGHVLRMLSIHGFAVVKGGGAAAAH